MEKSKKKITGVDRRFLDDTLVGCGQPGCDCTEGPFYIRSGCHKEAGVQVCYRDGILFLECRACGALVIPVKVHEERRLKVVKPDA